MYLNVLHCELLTVAHAGPVAAASDRDVLALNELAAAGLVVPRADADGLFYAITPDGARAIEAEGWVAPKPATER